MNNQNRKRKKSFQTHNLFLLDGLIKIMQLFLTFSSMHRKAKQDNDYNTASLSHSLLKISHTTSHIPNFVTENNTVVVLYDVIEICDFQLQLISAFDGQIQYNHGYNQ